MNVSSTKTNKTIIVYGNKIMNDYSIPPWPLGSIFASVNMC